MHARLRPSTHVQRITEISFRLMDASRYKATGSPHSFWLAGPQPRADLHRIGVKTVPSARQMCTITAERWPPCTNKPLCTQQVAVSQFRWDSLTSVRNETLFRCDAHTASFSMRRPKYSQLNPIVVIGPLSKASPYPPGLRSGDNHFSDRVGSFPSFTPYLRCDPDWVRRSFDAPVGGRPEMLSFERSVVVGVWAGECDAFRACSSSSRPASCHSPALFCRLHALVQFTCAVPSAAPTRLSVRALVRSLQ